MLCYFDNLGVDLFLHVLNIEGAQGNFDGACSFFGLIVTQPYTCFGAVLKLIIFGKNLPSIFVVTFLINLYYYTKMHCLVFMVSAVQNKNSIIF